MGKAKAAAKAPKADTAHWAARIDKLTAKYGSLEAVAAKLAVNFATVYRWHAGKCKPSRMAQVQIMALEKG